MNGHESEVLIVGGGPAGSMAAYCLAHRGFSVTLLEVSTRIKRKICGQYLCPPGVRLLKECGLMDQLPDEACKPAYGVKVVAPNGLTLEGNFPSEAGQEVYGFCLNRPVFEEAMLAEAARAGAQIRRGCRAGSIRRISDKWTVKTTDNRCFTASILIGADGRHSLVARTLGLHRETPSRRVALRCFLRTRRPVQRIIEMHLMPDGAYMGIDVVSEREVNLTMVCDTAKLKAMGSKEAVIRHYINQSRTLTEELAVPEQRFPIVESVSPITHRVRGSIGHNAVLIGDAGGFVDPLTGDGIYIALYSACILAEELVRARNAGRLEEPSRELQAFERRKQEIFGQKTRATRFLTYFIRYRQLCNRAGSFILAKPHRQKGMIGILGNLYSPLEGLRLILFGVAPRRFSGHPAYSRQRRAHREVL